MSDYVELGGSRVCGRPEPALETVLDGMFGVDGWCRECGVDFVAQCGAVRLPAMSPEREKAWVPWWRWNSICLEESIAELVAERFDVRLMDVECAQTGVHSAKQIVSVVTEYEWFDVEALNERALAIHGRTGSTCGSCGTWKWVPVRYPFLPITIPLGEDRPVIESPEWFGGGLNARHDLLVDRDLAKLLAEASPDRFRVGSSQHIRYV